jgi:hypothetical protein
LTEDKQWTLRWSFIRITATYLQISLCLKINNIVAPLTIATLEIEAVCSHEILVCHQITKKLSSWYWQSATNIILSKIYPFVLSFEKKGKQQTYSAFHWNYFKVVHTFRRPLLSHYKYLVIKIFKTKILDLDFWMLLPFQRFKT